MSNEELKEKITGKMVELLRSRGLDNPINLSLVDDYARLFDIKEALIADINERGVSVPYREMEDGSILKKKNDCIAELHKTVGQMSKITFDLGIRACDMDIEDVPLEV